MKILLISEAPLSENAGGMSQTLYNLFSFCKPEEILCVAPREELKRCSPTGIFIERYIDYRFEIFSVPRNRVGSLVKPFINWLNYRINQLRNFKRIKQKIKQFDPMVVVSCPNGAVGVFMHDKLLNELSVPVYPYFMDDWMYKMKDKIGKWDLHKSISKMLRHSSGWLMISDQLGNILKERYKQSPQRALKVHNPVSLSDISNVEPAKAKEEYIIAYAGALWPMHFDGFIVVAKAVHQLSQKRKIKLIVYTGDQYWQWRKESIEPLGVVNGGHIPYKQIHSKLSEADCLLVASSFEKNLFTHAQASIQTKITDYLKSQRLIISCGPSYSANHTFLKENQCGVCLESNSVDAAAYKIEEILNNIESYQFLIDNGIEVLKTQFGFDYVQSKLRSFLSNTEGN